MLLLNYIFNNIIQCLLIVLFSQLITFYKLGRWTAAKIRLKPIKTNTKERINHIVALIIPVMFKIKKTNDNTNNSINKTVAMF